MKKILTYIFITTLSIEISMQITSFAFSSWMSYSQRSQNSGKGKFKVLCLGESTTAWGGLDSYPAILERKLNSLTRPGTFEVVNAGIPGTTTRVIMGQLPRWIAEHNPDVTIVMAGVNDLWSLPDNDPEPWEKSLEWLSQYSRIAKLIRLTNVNSKYQNLEIKKPVIATCGMQVEAGYMVPSKFNDDVFQADLILQKAGYQKAVAFLEKQIKKLNTSGFCADAYPLQEQIIKYQRDNLKNPKLALATVESILKSDVIPLRRPSVVALKNSLRAQLGFSPDDRKYPNGATYWENSSYKINIQQIISQLQGHKIPVIVMQYPRLSIEPLKKIIINHNGLIFLENKKNFEQILKEKKLDEIFLDMFGVAFGHTTPLGAHVIANNAAKIVMELVPVK